MSVVPHTVDSVLDCGLLLSCAEEAEEDEARDETPTPATKAATEGESQPSAMDTDDKSSASQEESTEQAKAASADSAVAGISSKPDEATVGDEASLQVAAAEALSSAAVKAKVCFNVI